MYVFPYNGVGNTVIVIFDESLKISYEIQIVDTISSKNLSEKLKQDLEINDLDSCDVFKISYTLTVLIAKKYYCIL